MKVGDKVRRLDGTGWGNMYEVHGEVTSMTPSSLPAKGPHREDDVEVTIMVHARPGVSTQNSPCWVGEGASELEVIP